MSGKLISTFVLTWVDDRGKREVIALDEGTDLYDLARKDIQNRSSPGPCKRRHNRECGQAQRETAPCAAHRTDYLSVGGLQPVFQESPSY